MLLRNTNINFIKLGRVHTRAAQHGLNSMYCWSVRCLWFGQNACSALTVLKVTHLHVSAFSGLSIAQQGIKLLCRLANNCKFLISHFLLRFYWRKKQTRISSWLSHVESLIYNKVHRRELLSHLIRAGRLISSLWPIFFFSLSVFQWLFTHQLLSCTSPFFFFFFNMALWKAERFVTFAC